VADCRRVLFARAFEVNDHDVVACRRFTGTIRYDADFDDQLSVEQLDLFHSWFAEADASGGTDVLACQSLDTRLLADQDVITAFIRMLMFVLLSLRHCYQLLHSMLVFVCGDC
jgi:hypothetical protein